MNNIDAGHLKLNILPSRDVNIVGSHNLRIGVPELPPPLVANHLDLHHVSRLHRVLGLGAERQHRDHQQINAGAIVHMISIRVLPWICAGIGSLSERWRKRNTE